MRESMQTVEIVLPLTRPETEWVAGRAVKKVSPTRAHSRLALELGSQLHAWVAGRGEIGVEWRFRVQPPGERRRPLVPDLSFVRIERLRGQTLEDLAAPAFAPDVAIEILSPDDRPGDVAEKVRVYLASGSALVVEIDPTVRTATLHDPTGSTTIPQSGALLHAALPGFRIELSALFSVLAPPQ